MTLKLYVVVNGIVVELILLNTVFDCLEGRVDPEDDVHDSDCSLNEGHLGHT